MKCIECNNEFSSVNNRGVEQKYCSLKCRNKSAFKRREERLKNTYFSPSDNSNININNNEKENETIQRNSGNQQSMDRGQQREYTQASNRVGIIADSHLSTIKELYEAKNETTFYKLKCEMIEKELNELRIENAQLESELDEIDSEAPEGQYSGMLGGVMEQFKVDPVNTINFATELIGNLFKPKK
jgi:hypothetical protein